MSKHPRNRAMRRKLLHKEKRKASHTSRKAHEEAITRAFWQVVMRRDKCEECGLGRRHRIPCTVYAPYVSMRPGFCRVNALLRQTLAEAPRHTEDVAGWVNARPWAEWPRYCPTCYEIHYANLDGWIPYP